MRWTERQRAMLREMGVRMWSRDVEAETPRLAHAADVIEVDAPSPETRPASTPPSPSNPSASEPSGISGASPVPMPTDAAWLPADWLIVGEPFDAAAGAAQPSAAGEQERLLANMLQAVRVSRGAAERSARACHFALAEGTRAQLDAVLEGVRPRLILALGRAAAEALLDVDEPIGRLRGQVHDRAGVRVVVSFPLAYLLRNPSEKAKAWADLCLAVRTLEVAAI